MGAMTTSLETKVSIPETVLFRELGGEAVLLVLDKRRYYGLDEMGTQMWHLLREHENLQQVYKALLGAYDVSEQRLREDLFEFVHNLVSRNIVELHES